MHKVSSRLALVAVAVLVAIAAAFVLREIDRRTNAIATTEQQFTARIDRLTDAIAGVGAAQQAYIAPGQQLDQQAFERMTLLVRQIYDETASLKPLLGSADAESAVQALNAATGNVITADARARENLRLGQQAMAADVIFSDGRSTLDGMNGRVRALRDAERAFYESERARFAQQRWMVLGVVTLASIAVLLLLVPVRAPSQGVAIVAKPAEPQQDVPAIDAPAIEPAAPLPSAPLPDLAVAADLCTALSRLNATADLPPLLGRAAQLLDASGIILWLGAGEDLFAVTAHGYRPEIISRLRPIARSADNATAAAWRTGEITLVSGDTTGNGAIVTPMFGPDACIGALAVEVRHGREQDPATRALASLISAQLATVVGAWPQASTAAELRSASA